MPKTSAPPIFADSPDFVVSLARGLEIIKAFGVSGGDGVVRSNMLRLGCSRAFILSTSGHANQARELEQTIKNLVAGVFSEAVMHTPVSVSEKAVSSARSVNADCVVAIGGGSTVGLGKAIALRTDLPQIVIPTTHAWSEMTPILGETAEGEKTTQRRLKVLPESGALGP